MLYRIIHLLVDFAGTLLAGACLLRAWMQLRRVNMRNPLGQFVMTLTNWLVLPLRRVIPGQGGVDWSSLLAAFAVSLTAAVVLAGLASALGAGSMPSVLALVATAVLWLLKWVVYLAQTLVLASVILSWVNPFSPILPLIDLLVAPLLHPIRRVLPRMGRLDLSPLVFLLVAQIALIILQELSAPWLFRV